MSAPQVAQAYAPASISNLGPGFDALGAAVGVAGDHVTASWQANDSGSIRIDVSFHANSSWTGPTDPERNTAAVAAQRVLEHAELSGSARLEINKGYGAGTGLGSSAASAVAGAVAMNAAIGSPFSKAELVDPVMKGEAAVSGVEHGDNVLPSLFGGFVLMRSVDPNTHVRIAGWEDLGIVVVRPEIEVLTKQARDILPSVLSLPEAVDHAARLALLVDALHRRDIDALGLLMMSDPHIEPRRAGLIPHFEAVQRAALDAGASGCGLSGSGPAMMAFVDRAHEEQSQQVSNAVRHAMSVLGINCHVNLTHIDNGGARVVSSPVSRIDRPL